MAMAVAPSNVTVAIRTIEGRFTTLFDEDFVPAEEELMGLEVAAQSAANFRRKQRADLMVYLGNLYVQYAAQLGHRHVKPESGEPLERSERMSSAVDQLASAKAVYHRAHKDYSAVAEPVGCVVVENGLGVVRMAQVKLGVAEKPGQEVAAAAKIFNKTAAAPAVGWELRRLFQVNAANAAMRIDNSVTAAREAIRRYESALQLKRFSDQPGIYLAAALAYARNVEWEKGVQLLRTCHHQFQDRRRTRFCSFFGHHLMG